MFTRPDSIHFDIRPAHTICNTQIYYLVDSRSLKSKVQTISSPKGNLKHQRSITQVNKEPLLTSSSLAQQIKVGTPHASGSHCPFAPKPSSCPHSVSLSNSSHPLGAQKNIDVQAHACWLDQPNSFSKSPSVHMPGFWSMFMHHPFALICCFRNNQNGVREGPCYRRCWQQTRRLGSQGILSATLWVPHFAV